MRVLAGSEQSVHIDARGVRWELDVTDAAGRPTGLYRLLVNGGGVEGMLPSPNEGVRTVFQVEPGDYEVTLLDRAFRRIGAPRSILVGREGARTTLSF